MNTLLVLTVLSDDHPGIVEQLAQTISQHQGNWLESRMAKLGGKFAGILQVAIDETQEQQLVTALTSLSVTGIKIIVEKTNSAQKPDSRMFEFSVIGSDRPGIVREIAQAFASRHINMDKLETACSSMPWSGEPLFEATGIIEVPKKVDMNELHDYLDKIADQLAVDIRIESSTNETILS